MQYKITNTEYIHGGTQKDVYERNEVVVSSCMICGSTNHTKLYSERGCLGIVRCNECDLIYTNPRAKDAENNYFGDYKVFFEEAKLIFQNKKKHHRDKNYEYELKNIKKLKPAGKLLDIGSNMGFFLKKAEEFGYETEGIEPSSALSKIATEQFKLKITNSFLKKDTFTQKRFDIITMIDVFEHVTNPCELLKNSIEILKDDGIVCIKVPNGNYNLLKLKLAKLFDKENLYDIFNSYEHVGHYTIKTMKTILNNSGFRLKKIIIPVPVNPPIWANLVGHYYQYPSPFILDWKRILLRNLFWQIGKIEKIFGLKKNFAPDLMFIASKQSF